uniref:Uncharacterized protein n=1 Tax=Anopheles maculatus TaxID=74869 RepID=A0A182T874_9DIPT
MFSASLCPTRLQHSLIFADELPLALLIPTVHVRVDGKVKVKHPVQCRDRDGDREIGHRDVLPGRPATTVQEAVQYRNRILHLLKVFRLAFASHQDGMVVGGDTAHKRADVVKQPLVHFGAQCYILRVQRIVRAIFFCQIDQYGTGLPDHDVAIDQGGNVVLRV